MRKIKTTAAIKIKIKGSTAIVDPSALGHAWGFTRANIVKLNITHSNLRLLSHCL